jgi:hypothetical protein
MELDWRRIAGALAAAVYFTLLVTGGTLFVRSGAALVSALVTMALVAIIVYRAVPAIQENWERRRRIEGRHPMQPTPSRVGGALAIAAIMTLGFYAIEQLLFPDQSVEVAGAIRTLMVFLMPGYALWPAVELRLRG